MTTLATAPRDEHARRAVLARLDQRVDPHATAADQQQVDPLATVVDPQHVSQHVEPCLDHVVDLRLDQQCVDLRFDAVVGQEQVGQQHVATVDPHVDPPATVADRHCATVVDQQHRPDHRPVVTIVTALGGYLARTHALWERGQLVRMGASPDPAGSRGRS